MFNDLREWLEQAKALGEIREVNGAHWDQEIGAVTDMVNCKRNGPAVLFDEIVDYPKGHRIKDEFPEVVEAPPELMKSVKERWGSILE